MLDLYYTLKAYCNEKKWCDFFAFPGKPIRTDHKTVSRMKIDPVELFLQARKVVDFAISTATNVT